MLAHVRLGTPHLPSGAKSADNLPGDMADATFDIDWPVMRITLPQTMNTEEIDAFCATISAEYSRRDGWIQVVDLNAVQPLSVPATVRRHFAQASDEVDRRFPNGTRAQAICTESVVIRGVFTAYSWLKRHQTFKVKAFASQADAAPWVDGWAALLSGETEATRGDAAAR